MMLRRMTNTGTISVLSGGPAEHGTGGAMTAWDGGGGGRNCPAIYHGCITTEKGKFSGFL